MNTDVRGRSLVVTEPPFNPETLRKDMDEVISLWCNNLLVSHLKGVTVVGRVWRIQFWPILTKIPFMVFGIWIPMFSAGRNQVPRVLSSPGFWVLVQLHHSVHRWHSSAPCGTNIVRVCLSYSLTLFCVVPVSQSQCRREVTDQLLKRDHELSTVEHDGWV